MRRKSFLTKWMSLLFCAVLLASCGGGGGTSGGGGAVGSSTDKIFYWFYPYAGDFTNELYMIYGDGSGNRQITFTNDAKSKVLFGASSDGYAIYRYTPSTGYDSLYSVPLSNPTQLTTKLLADGSINSAYPYSITTNNLVIYDDINDKLYSVKADGSESAKQLTAGTAIFLGITSSNLLIYSDSTGLFSIDPAAANPAITLKTLDSAATNLSDTYAEIWNDVVVYVQGTGLYKVDASAATPSRTLLDTGSPTNMTASNGYIFYNKWNVGGGSTGQDVYAVDLTAATPAVITLAKTTGDEYFVAFSPAPDNRVIYRKYNNTHYDIYSVGITGGASTTLMASSTNDVFKGLTVDSRVIIQTENTVNFDYDTITSIKTDGTGLLTLASGKGTAAEGGIIKAITADGWIIYLKGSGTMTLTTIKADNTASGSFTDYYSGTRLGITSNNVIVPMKYNYTTYKYQLYTVNPDGSGSTWLNTPSTQYSLDTLTKIVY